MDVVTVVGYPISGDTISVISGVVSRIEVLSYVHGSTKLLGVQIDATINAGNSGGPAFNGIGECVGIAFQSLKYEDAENIGYVIPTPVINHFFTAMVKEFLKTHDLIFANKPDYAHGKYVCYDHKDVAFSPYRDYWRQKRKLCTVELLTVKTTESFRFVREEEVSSMLASIWQESGHGAQCVDVRKRLSSLTQNITLKMFTSRTYSNNELSGRHGFKKMVEEITSMGGAFCIGDFIPSVNWLDIQGIHRRMQAIS